MTESTVGWFGLREKYCSLADKPDTSKRTGWKMTNVLIASTSLVFSAARARHSLWEHLSRSSTQGAVKILSAGEERCVELLKKLEKNIYQTRSKLAPCLYTSIIINQVGQTKHLYIIPVLVGISGEEEPPSRSFWPTSSSILLWCSISRTC